MFKVYPGLIASSFLVTEEGHSWRVWLWETQGDLKRWAERYAAGPKEPGEFNDALGLHTPCEVEIDGEFQHIGEIHFIKDSWDLEHVAHECTHGLFHYIRCLVSDFPRMLYLNIMECEEEVCYPFGQFVDMSYRWLWKKNPNPKWLKENV